MEQHFTVKEVADYLRISRWSVGRYIESGELTALKAGEGRTAAVRIPASSLADFIERHTVAAVTASEEKR